MYTTPGMVQNPGFGMNPLTRYSNQENQRRTPTGNQVTTQPQPKPRERTILSIQDPETMEDVTSKILKKVQPPAKSTPPPSKEPNVATAPVGVIEPEPVVVS